MLGVDGAVGGLLIVHKWFVVRDVGFGVHPIISSQARVMLATAARPWVSRRLAETILEPSQMTLFN